MQPVYEALLSDFILSTVLMTETEHGDKYFGWPRFDDED